MGGAKSAKSEFRIFEKKIFKKYWTRFFFEKLQFFKVLNIFY